MFKIYKNILNKKEQKDLLAFVKTKIQSLGEDYPGLQTKSDLHTYKELNPFLRKINKHIKYLKKVFLFMLLFLLIEFSCNCQIVIASNFIYLKELGLCSWKFNKIQ